MRRTFRCSVCSKPLYSAEVIKEPSAPKAEFCRDCDPFPCCGFCGQPLPGHPNHKGRL